MTEKFIGINDGYFYDPDIDPNNCSHPDSVSVAYNKWQRLCLLCAEELEMLEDEEIGFNS